MTSLFLLSIWPVALSRELLMEPVEVMGLRVQSWLTDEPTPEVQQHLKHADCLVLPAAEKDHWHCLTSDVMYSWDYSVQPSVWSESQRLAQSANPTEINWQGGALTVTTSQQALFVIYHQVRREAQSPGAQIYLEHQYQGAFVYGWYFDGRDHVVSAWRNDNGSSYVVRLYREWEQ